MSSVRNILTELGLRLREARINRHLTTREVAGKISTSDKTYRRLEQGEPFVAIKHYVAAALLLDVDFAKPMAEVLASRKKRVRKEAKINKDEVDF